jgi:hypothetical protein
MYIRETSFAVKSSSTNELISQSCILESLYSDPLNMKKRSLSGNCGVAVFVIALVTVCVAFATPSWLVSDYRITGAKLDRLGLWVHCFRSLPDVNDDYQRRFFVGCRWVYDPFTTGYDQIRGFLLPGKNSFESAVKLKIFKLIFIFLKQLL